MFTLEKYDELKHKAPVLELLDNELIQGLELDFDGFLFLALEEDAIVAVAGFNTSHRIIEPFIYVDKKHRRRGVGKALMTTMEEHIRLNPAIIHGQYCIKDFHSNEIQFLYAMNYYDWMVGDWLIYEGPKLDHRHIKVRNYQDSDFKEYFRIESTTMFLMRETVGASHNVYWPVSERARQYHLSNADNTFILEVDGKIVGVGNISGHELEEVCICPRHQGQGLGTEFTKYLINTILDRGHKNVILEAMVGNPSRRIYERLGFKDIYKVHYLVKFYGEDNRLKALPAEYII